MGFLVFEPVVHNKIISLQKTSLVFRDTRHIEVLESEKFDCLQKVNKKMFSLIFRGMWKCLYLCYDSCISKFINCYPMRRDLGNLMIYNTYGTFEKNFGQGTRFLNGPEFWSIKPFANPEPMLFEAFFGNYIENFPPSTIIQKHSKNDRLSLHRVAQNFSKRFVLAVSF